MKGRIVYQHCGGSEKGESHLNNLFLLKHIKKKSEREKDPVDVILVSKESYRLASDRSLLFL